jgi:hypothetical protein
MKNTAKSLKRSAMAKFIMQTPKVKEKHQQSIVKRQSDPTFHDKKNSALQETYKDPTWQANIAAANKSKPLDPAYKAAHQASYTPEANKRRSESCKKALNTPDAKARASIHATSMWQNKEHRVKIQQCIKTPAGVFESHKTAAVAYGIGRGAFSNRFKKENIKNPDLWKNISREEYEQLAKSNTTATPTKKLIGAPKYVFTEFGVFRGLAKAGRHAASLGIPNARKWIDKQIKNHPDKFYFISKEEYDLLKGAGND